MKKATIIALVGVVAAGAFALTAALETGCYRCDGPNCSNIPSVIQPDYPARPRDAGPDAR